MTRIVRWASAAAVAALLVAACGGEDSTNTGGGGETAAQGTAKAGGTMTVALAEDPDLLDPTLARTFVGRIVFANLCEKLYDVDENLGIVPQLAASLPKITNGGRTVTIDIRQGLKFNDGTTLDAQAVKQSLDRHRTLKASSRASELEPVTSVQAVDDDTVRLRVDGPYAPLTAQLADRAGMVMSPKQLDKLGEKFSSDPVCVGPFRFVSRAEGDRIVLEKAPDYYDAAKVKLDRLVFRIIEEGSARSANLRSGDVNVAERLDPTDLAAVRADSNLQVIDRTSLGYQGVTVNIGNKNGLGEKMENVGTPLAEEKALRQAFSLSLDRAAINKVVFQGNYVPGCGPLSPVSPFYDKSLECPARDLAKAKQLVQQSGVPTPVPVRMMLNTDATTLRLGQTIQAMAKEAGFAVRLQPTEFTSALDKGDAGDYDTFQVGWSGRIDPDGNIQQFVGTTGSQNISGYSSDALDKLLEQGRSELDQAKRTQIYRQVTDALMDDSPLIYLYHDKYFTGAGGNVTNLRFFGDGLLRFKEAGFSAES